MRFTDVRALFALLACTAAACGGSKSAKPDGAATGAAGANGDAAPVSDAGGAAGTVAVDGPALDALVPFDGNLGDAAKPPAPTFAATATMKPRTAALPTSELNTTPRPLSRVAGPTGGGADFVSNELIVVNDDLNAVQDFAKRWSGTVVKTLDFAAAGLKNVPAISLVRVDASAADTSRLGADLQTLDPLAHGDHQLSDDAGLHLLAAAGREGASGARVGLNWVMYSSGIAEGATVESPTRATDPASSLFTYSPDAFMWPYMQSGGAQDVGVGAAWRALLASGKLGNRVKVMVMDGGFAPSADFPANRTVWPPGAWNVPNPSSCTAGFSCPYHGTWVTTALAGQIDDHFGAAGPGAPVVDLVAVQSPAPDLFSYLEYVASVLVALVADTPRIINISAEVKVPGSLGFLVAPLNLVTLGLDSTGISIFACAGNEGEDVDHQDSILGYSWESDVYIPCEMDGVTCVGGLDWASTSKAGPVGMGSNWGSQERFGAFSTDSSVDIYGPFYTWVGPVPGQADGLARVEGGTSFSSPFVAGVAALVLAANPALSTGDVRSILFSTAHQTTSIIAGGFGGGQWVDAFAAVQKALGGGDIPAYVRIDSPTAGRTVSWRQAIQLAATAFDVDSPNMPVIQWSSDRDGALGTGTPLSAASLTPGAHVITATATSGTQHSTATVALTVRDDPPAVTLTQPAPGATFCASESIHFRATVTDVNNPPAFPFPAANVTWSSVPAGLTGAGGNLLRTLPVGGYTVTVRAVDEQGLADMKSVAITVASCVNNPPTVSISSPAAGTGSGPDFDVYATGQDANGAYIAVMLSGSATDPEDGILSGASLVWTTSAGAVQPGGSGALGTGAGVIVKLYSSCLVGYSGTVDHVITLTAKDSGGVSRTATRVVRVKTLC